ncbi:cytochrome P450 6k1 isoform X2 [Cephus cinctus]|uniref:Cytochrome P450 6k1 isoform X2 n=1 Tax=Cephus cinctus TaxID=211228 RepID=A0AAJ7W232_CEPCN|nr:cytochrome P450 6k1 isoform X2 [Cephus cinctus]
MLFGLSLYFDLLLGLVTLIISVVLYLRYNMSYWERHGIPYIKPNLLLGNFDELLIKRVPTGLFGQNMYERGAGHPMVGIWALQTPSLLIRDPDLIKNILVKDFNYFCDRYSGGDGDFDPVGRKNLFMTNNPHWKTLRTHFSPIFTGNKLRNVYQIMMEISDGLTDYYKEKCGQDGATFELKDLYTSSIEVISSCMFGIKANSIRDPDCTIVENANKLINNQIKRLLEITIYFMVPQLIDIFRVQLAGSTTNFFRNLCWDSIKQREKNGIKRGDVVDCLLKIRNESKFEDDMIVAQTFIFFAAGFETSGTTTSFCIHYLAAYPEIQERAREEAMAIKEKYGSFTYESLSEAKYIESIIQETLRLYPPMPILNRICVKDYKVPDMDFVIKKGTPIFVGIMGMHKDPEYFPEPEKFDPDRFSDERKADIKPQTYMPFGEGPRICIGMRFAMLSIKLSLCSFLTNFRAERCAETQFPVKLVLGTLTMMPENGLNVKVVPLTSCK